MIENKAVVVYPYEPFENQIEILNNLTFYIKEVQKQEFDNYVREHNIRFDDERSLNAIRKFEMEYVNGTMGFISFRVTINYPEVESKYKTVSVYNTDDYLYTNNYSFLVSMGFTSHYNIGKEYTDVPRLSMETLYSKIHPSFLSKVFDKFRTRYYLNSDISRNVFKRQVPFLR